MSGGQRLYAGIDPAGGPHRPTGVAILDDGLRVRSVGKAFTDEDIETFLEPWKRGLAGVALDGPVGLPRGLNRCCFRGDARPSPCPCAQPGGVKGREAERRLSAMGIGLYYVTKNAFARDWILRSLELNDRLVESGYRVLEVFPYGAKRVLWGGKISPGGKFPAKQTRRGRRFLLGCLEGEGVRFPGGALPGDHELDAVIGAYVAWLHRRGRTEAFGDPAEGEIVLPAGRKRRNPRVG